MGEALSRKLHDEKREFVRLVRAFVQGPIGLGLLFAWFYCTFYSCVLVQNLYTIRESERYWAVSLFVAAVVSAILFAFMRRGRRVGGMRGWAFAAASCAGMSAAFIFAGYIIDPIDVRLSLLGALLAGAALPVLALLWIDVIKAHDEEVIEFSIPAAFLVSLAVYLPVVALKNILSVIVVACLPLISVAVAIRYFNRERKRAGFRAVRAGLLGTAKPAVDDDVLASKGLGRSFFRNAAGLWKTGALFSLLWFSFAFFRSCVSPTYFTDRFDHYLAPFVCAGVLAACIMVLAHRNAHSVGLFTTYRWVLPFMLAGYALLFVNDPFLGRFAFTASFIGLVGVQLCCVMVAAKFARKNDIPAGYVLLPFVVFIGVGTACGVVCGMVVLDSGADAGEGYPLLMVMLVAAVMAWGCDADCLIDRPERAVVKKKQSGGGPRLYSLQTAGAKIIDSVAMSQAGVLSERYGLSPREREILGYLLAGRSRPYIRDELVLSLNTVNTHVRNIYAKVGVHSQQELLTLVRTADEDSDAESLPVKPSIRIA